MSNLFRQAKELLDKKDAGAELTEEELQLINTAIIPLMIIPEDITIGEGLERLAKMMEEATQFRNLSCVGNRLFLGGVTGR